MPRPVAVIAVVIAAFAAIALFGTVVATQLGVLAENLPLYQRNIEAKVRVVKNANVGEGVVDRVSRLLERLGAEIRRNDNAAAGRQPARHNRGTPQVKPLPVEVVEPQLQPLQVLQTIIGPLIEPLATGGIIIVVVIFMLMKREDLRDRFIRLVGASDLHRTTEALQDAGKRVGQYLLMQLIVNVTYAIPIGIGLWIIGVPNPLLWGLLALVLRFVPYIGPIIAAVFPLLLALAVDPGWTMVLWTAALVRRRRADQQQRHRAVALWLAHRPVAAGHHRGGDLLDLAVGSARPASVDAAHRVPRGARPACAAIRIPRRAVRQRAGAGAARGALSAAAGRRSGRSDRPRRGVSRRQRPG